MTEQEQLIVMEQYIKKSALAAEIKARISDIEVSQKAGLIKKRDADKKMLIFKSVLSLIDTLEVKEIGVDLGDSKGDKSTQCIIDTKTLEVKEVDLEKELDTWRHNHFHGRRDKDASGEYLERSSQLELAKHFFELGLKAQKGE